MADTTSEGKGPRDLMTFLGWTRPLAKEIGLVDGVWVKRAAPEAKHFDASEAKVASLSDVERRLRQAAEVGAVLIHGRLKADLSPRGVLRRKPNFDDMPHRWIVVDLDALPPGPANPADAATIARGMLPAEFHGAACIWQATAGHALEPGKVRLRLIFWGARPVSLAEVDAWLSDCEAKPDRSVWRTVQPIYLGTRVVGGPDPVPQRWGRLPGAAVVAVPPDLAAVAKATVERLTTMPDNVTPDAQRMVEDVVALLRSRTADRIGRDGRHMTLFHAANDALDRGLTEPVTLAMLTAWTAGDDEAEAELADALKEAGVSTAADLARSVRLSGEALADAWSSGEPLEVDAVERMTGDALQSRTAPVGNLYREPVAFGSLPTVEDALAAVEEAVTLGLDLDAPAELLRVAMTNDDAPEGRTAAAMQAVERLKAGAVDAMDQLDRIVREHGKAEGSTAEAPAVNVKAPARPARFRFETAADLEAEADVDSVFIVEDLIEAGTLFVLYGNPGAGKSAIILDMLLRIAHGLPWAGRATTRTGVLYLSPEGPKGLKRRYKAWHTHMRENGHVVGGAPFEVLRQQVDLYGSDIGINAIAEQVRTFKRRHGIACGIVVVDTLRQALVGGDENSARDIGTFTQKLTSLRDAYGVVCGIVHHDGKDASRGAAGSTAIIGNVDIELAVEKPKGSRLGTIRAGKMRDGFLDGRVPYELKSGVGEVRQDGTTKSAVVAVLGGSDPTSSLGAVEDETEEAADLGTPVDAVEADPDSDDARDVMMMQAARSLRAAFSRRDLYAAVRNLRTGAKLDRADISDTRLDAVRMRLQLRGEIVREGEGKSSRWVVGTE